VREDESGDSEDDENDELPCSTSEVQRLQKFYHPLLWTWHALGWVLGSKWSSRSTGVMWSRRCVPVISRAVAFCANCNLRSRVLFWVLFNGVTELSREVIITRELLHLCHISWSWLYITSPSTCSVLADVCTDLGRPLPHFCHRQTEHLLRNFHRVTQSDSDIKLSRYYWLKSWEIINMLYHNIPTAMLLWWIWGP